MLILELGSCEKCGGSLGSHLTTQQAGVTCKACGHDLKACPRCKREGCPKCGGELLNAWEHVRHTTGQDILF